jgi:cytochrome c oxidase assembly protein subunit 15
MTMSRKIYLWLFISAGFVFMMALIGAITRLTESGLSIVEWKPVAGAMPPMNEAAWLAEFAKYKDSPQYLKINHGMTLEEFKQIFFWEWVHRQWGRLIGVVYAVPLLFFWRHIAAIDRKYFIGILLLGLLQGAMGWYMVKSGLVDQPSVSHYRLAAHLMLAFVIYACLFRLGLSYAFPFQAGNEKFSALKPFIRATVAAAGLTMVWGAFVAGLDAGLLYNTFPKMDAHWFPPETRQYKSVWLALVEEPATVQFVHRVLAVLVVVKVAVLSWRAFRLQPTGRLKKLFIALPFITLAQAGLGIATLLTQVHIHPAVMHQGGAMVLLSVLVWLLHDIPDKEKI